MSQAVWVLHLPKKVEIEVDSGQQVKKGQILARSDKENFKSPTKGEIDAVKPKKIRLKFSTDKIVGEGYGKESVWGELEIYEQLKLPDINFNLAGKLIFVPKLSNLVLKKSAVIGVSGFVTYLWEEEGKSLEIPVLEISKEEKDKLNQYETQNCLLHASKNCLLIPENED